MDLRNKDKVIFRQLPVKVQNVFTQHCEELEVLNGAKSSLPGWNKRNFPNDNPIGDCTYRMKQSDIDALETGNEMTEFANEDLIKFGDLPGETQHFLSSVSGGIEYYHGGTWRKRVAILSLVSGSTYRLIHKKETGMKEVKNEGLVPFKNMDTREKDFLNAHNDEHVEFRFVNERKDRDWRKRERGVGKTFISGTCYRRLTPKTEGKLTDYEYTEMICKAYQHNKSNVNYTLLDGTVTTNLHWVKRHTDIRNSISKKRVDAYFIPPGKAKAFLGYFERSTWTMTENYILTPEQHAHICTYLESIIPEESAATKKNAENGMHVFDAETYSNAGFDVLSLSQTEQVTGRTQRIKPWTDDTFPFDKVLHLREKATGYRFTVLGMCSNYVGVELSRANSPEVVDVSYVVLASEYEQLDQSPCGS